MIYYAILSISVNDKYVARMVEVRSAYILAGRPEGRRPLGRPRRRWKDIKIILGK
jgi:hypothetical protein